MPRERIAVMSGLGALFTASVLLAEPVLTESFETKGKWRKLIRGKGSVELVDGGVRGKCLKVTSQDEAFVYYSTDLPLERVRGRRLIIRAQVKLDGVVQGPEVYSTAKLHVGITVGKTTQHRAQRFVGTRGWHHQVLIAEVPEDARRVVLDLGIQNGTGTAWFDSLVVDDGVKEHVPISIRPAANASTFDELAEEPAFDLRGMPVADVRLAGVDFTLMQGEENFGRTCIALRGAKRPDLPARIETVIPVGRKASRLFFLHAAVGADAGRREPCLVYTLHYADGKPLDVPMRQGIELGALENPKSLPNWKVAWTVQQKGRTVGLGVTTWRNPRPNVAIQWIRLSAPGKGAVPVVLAISLDPPR